MFGMAQEIADLLTLGILGIFFSYLFARITDMISKKVRGY